ncbi:hypothetical protein Mapa_015953 [Marchantia paleacea]|nr:hypothetical protein Mapa_015953 [Marchantia paleacea]
MTRTGPKSPHNVWSPRWPGLGTNSVVRSTIYAQLRSRGEKHAKAIATAPAPACERSLWLQWREGSRAGLLSFKRWLILKLLLCLPLSARALQGT